MLSELRLALRSLLKSPGFFSVAVFTIAIGIAANTTLYSVFRSVVLNPLDFPQSERLVRFWVGEPNSELYAPASSWPKYQRYRDHASSFSGLAASTFHNATLTGEGDAEQLNGIAVTSNFLSVLGIPLAQGREFTAEHDADGGPAAILLTHELWQNRFAGRPDILGQVIELNGVATTVIGILPAELPFPFNQAQYLVPRPQELPGVPPEQVATGGAVYLQLTGRLQDNVALESAAAEILTLSNAYNAEFPARMDANNNHFLRPFADELVGDMRPMFHVLIAACAFVLLIACANIASLFLGRLSARHKEIAVRLSLGATRRDIMRQFLMESLMFSLIAGVLGLLASMWAIDLVSTFASNQLPRADEIAFSGSVAAFSLIAAALTAVLVGLFPAWQASRANLTEVLKDTARSDGGGRAGRRLRAGLIIAEVTLSATLLIGASLLLTSFWKLLNADPGFDAQGTAIAFVNLPPNRYDTPEKRVAFHQQIEAELTRQPHITAASPIIGMPLSGFTPVMPYALKGEPIPSISERPLVGFRAAGVGYKDLLKLRLVEGRWFAETDTVDTPNVCVINESFARRIAPGESAVGRIVLSGRDGETENHVIGVIADLRTNGVNQPAPEELYYCAGQRAYPGMGIAARTTGDPALLQAAFRNALTQADPTIALSFFRTMDEAMRNALGVQRVSAWLVGCFAAISFLLAIVGLYSILAYNVTQRTMEIGIRMALGALPRDVIHAVLRQGLGLVAIGVVGGLLLAAGLSRLITAQLYGVPALSPTIYLGVATIYGLVATLACLLPARRASRVDPMVALRDE